MKRVKEKLLLSLKALLFLQGFSRRVFAINLIRYNNRTYRISGVKTEMTPLSTFTKSTKDGKGEPISFVDYYKTTRGSKISNLNQPLFEVIEKRKGFTPSERLDNNNSTASNYNTTIYLIPELCTMTGL